MSVQQITWAYKQKGISSGAKFLLVTLANYANHAGVSWPGQERLSRDLNVSSRSIRAWSEELEKAGLVKVTHRPGDGEGRKTNYYQLRQPENSSGRGQPEIYAGQPEQISGKPKEEPKEVKKEKINKKEKKKPRVFIPPDTSEVSTYAASLGYKGFDSDAFVDHYESVGWFVGKKKMVDWKAAVRGWNRRNKQYSRSSGGNGNRSYCAEDVGRAYQDKFGKPPPVGKSTDEVRQILAQRRDKQPQWYDA